MLLIRNRPHTTTRQPHDLSANTDTPACIQITTPMRYYSAATGIPEAKKSSVKT